VKLLLDTHAFLWFIEGSDELSKEAKRQIEDSENVRFLSMASLWEMAIKVSIGKLEVPLPFTRLVREHVEGNAIKHLPVKAEHLDAQRALPFHHHGPLDRLMIAQAQVEDLSVVSKDEAFEKYDIDLLW